MTPVLVLLGKELRQLRSLMETFPPKSSPERSPAEYKEAGPVVTVIKFAAWSLGAVILPAAVTYLASLVTKRQEPRPSPASSYVVTDPSADGGSGVDEYWVDNVAMVPRTVGH